MPNPHDDLIAQATKLAGDMERHATDDWDESDLLRALIAALAASEAARVKAEGERDSAIRGRDSWRDDYKALSAAIAGDTGLSAMTVAMQARLFRPRAEAAESRVAELEAALKPFGFADEEYADIANHEGVIITRSSNNETLNLVFMSDLRRARATLAGKE